MKFIVISHLHGDHCDGIVELAKEYTNAQLYISQINLLESFRNLIKFQHPNLKFSGWTKGQKLYEYLSSNHNRSIIGLQEGDKLDLGPEIQLNVLYPSAECIDHFDSYYKTELDLLTQKVGDIENKKNNNAAEYIKIDFSENFNAHSVVIETITENCNTFYPADLEFEKERGLDYVIEKLNSAGRKFNIIKAPHHGSKTSFDKAKWEQILVHPFKNQIFKLTCWKIGSYFLPEKKIIDSMSKITENIFCTGVSERKTASIKNSTKKYYNNPNLNFSVAAHNYGQIGINCREAEFKIDIDKPAVHYTELF